MITSKDIHGVIAAIATPFKDNEDLDLDGLITLTKYLLDGAVDGIMVVGGTGEFPHMDRQEKKAVVQTVSKEVNGAVPVIAGTAACTVRECITLMGDAKDAGADAAIMVPPYYFVLNEDALFCHFETLAREDILPVVVYNNPLYTGNPMSPNLLARLMRVDNIIGLKQSNADMGQLVEALRLTEAASSLCTGIDSQFFPALMAGASGIYSTAASVIPAQMKEIYTLFKENKFSEARRLHFKVQALNRFLEYDPGYVSPAKEALRMMGLPAGPVRRPMPELTQSQKAGLTKALLDLNVL